MINRGGFDGGHALIGAVGASGNGLREEVEARKVKDRLIEMFKENKFTAIDISCDEASSANYQLQVICNKANAQPLDLTIHLHLNSFSKVSANGVECFVISTNGQAYQYAKKIQHELVKNIRWYNRGVKTANFKVLRDTKAPAVLVELGFISNKGDMQKFDVEIISRSIFKAVVGKNYIAPKPPVDTTLWTLQRGAYSVKSNAKKEVARLKKLGIKSFDKFIDGYWKVQLGAFSVKSNAIKEQGRLQDLGVNTILAIK
ncbi:N-acetylmuramoyl-L-alanine amidase [uncultured Clostridium sp.]|uniref:N-acetylmuramoyl-L-alanine amidase n=1 Tax=uncultured Clostridium sp. TaxID=59620 RepID=UPI00261031B2|nr:N-acetylmuramoyl-L-alanine amidase [uncultured Clostridium sp.]